MTAGPSNGRGGGGTRVVCDDLEATLAHYVDELGYEVDEVFPADAPRRVVVSRHGERVRLESVRPPPAAVDPGPGPVVTRADAGAWVRGRAGMEYRDLVPGRCGGRLIASHIRITDGGPVPDYVHYHHVAFQLIFCVRGWVRVVYEDQGPAFVMGAGDCVLQPPRIRHRVLECGDGLEVVELSAPAEHRTVADRQTILPTATIDPDRGFDGQRFVRYQAAGARWQPLSAAGWEASDTGIEAATGGRGTVERLRASEAAAPLAAGEGETYSFHVVLGGALTLVSEGRRDQRLGPLASILVDPGRNGELRPASARCELLRVRLRAAGLDPAPPR